MATTPHHSPIIAVDFDGTIVKHDYPRIGAENHGAFEALRLFQSRGAKLVLWTMRSARELEEAIEHCRANGVEFFGVNNNPEQITWTTSPKAYAHLYIDDAAFGCPTTQVPGERMWVNWPEVTGRVLTWIDRWFERPHW